MTSLHLWQSSPSRPRPEGGLELRGTWHVPPALCTHRWSLRHHCLPLTASPHEEPGLPGPAPGGTCPHCSVGNLLPPYAPSPERLSPSASSALPLLVLLLLCLSCQNAGAREAALRPAWFSQAVDAQEIFAKWISGYTICVISPVIVCESYLS